MARIPKLGVHKGSGQFRVTINGKAVYLGRDKADAQSRYKRLIAEHLAGKQPSKPSSLSAREMGERWLRVAQPSVGKAEQCLMAQMVETLPSLKADGFKLNHARAMTAQFVERNHCRKTINKRLRYLRAMYQWAFEEELVSAETAATVKLVKNLKPGQPRRCLPDCRPTKEHST